MNLPNASAKMPNDKDYAKVKKNVSIAADTATTEDTPWIDLNDSKRKKLQCAHRVGPVPKQEWEESKGKSSGSKKSVGIGNLDSTDFLEEDWEGALTNDDKQRVVNHLKQNVSAGSDAIINYFSRMGAQQDNDEKIDYRFLNALLSNGASPNVADKYGQTVMHEVARLWNTDVAKFLISYGCDANIPDRWGRTPLHLAAATNHSEMVDYLIRSGANPRVQTHGEGQQVVHYAAKFNAVATLKVLLEHKVRYNVRDYKGRTPLFLAAEMACEESARYLLHIGDRVGIFDDTGMSCIAVMIEKMPQIAIEALDQFQNTEVAKRKEYFFLNYLESDPVKWQNERAPKYGHAFMSSQELPTKAELRELKKSRCPTSPLELAVKHGELDVIMHPAMQSFIQMKWELFGRVGASGGFLFHLVYVCLWTLLAVTLPRDADYYNKEKWRLYWRLPVEVTTVVMTFYFILKEILKNKLLYKSNQQFVSWRARQIRRDLQYCHPRWESQEKTFLENELSSLGDDGGDGLCTTWNMLECATYICIITVIATRVVDVFHGHPYANAIHIRATVFALIFVYLHFMKSCRPFPSLGMFITMFCYAIKETVTFAGMFLIFTIPYTIGFWMIFGGQVDASNPIFADNDDDDDDVNVGWVNFHEIMYFSWQVTLNVKFSKRSIMMDRVMAQMMLGTFYFSSTLLMFNMYIGLLTETFYKVYNNAKAYASVEQAITILDIEKRLSKKKKSANEDFIHENCEPVEEDMEEEEAGQSEEELWENVIRAIDRRFIRFMDFVTGADKKPAKKPTIQEETLKKYKEDLQEYNLYQGALARDNELRSMQMDLYELQCGFLKTFDPECSLPEMPTFKRLSILPIKEPDIPPAIKDLIPKKQAEITNKEEEPSSSKAQDETSDDDTNDDESNNDDDPNDDDPNDDDPNDDDDQNDFDPNDDNYADYDPNSYGPNDDDEDDPVDDDEDGNRSSRVLSAEYVDEEFLDPALNWEYPEDYYNGLLQIIEGHVPNINSLDRRQLRAAQHELAQNADLQDTQADNRWASTPQLNIQGNIDDVSSRGASSTYNRSTMSLQSVGLPALQSQFQSTASLQSIHEGMSTDLNPNVQMQDNALFRTIMNLKTSKIRYQMEPNRQNLHRILSMINEEESGAAKDKDKNK